MKAFGSLPPAGLVVVVVAVGALSACGSAGDEPAANPSATVLPSSSPSTCWGKGSDTPLPSTDPDAELYVGLSEQEALDLADERQQTVRVAGRDGECFPMTMDYQPERVNLYVEADQVVAATLG